MNTYTKIKTLIFGYAICQKYCILCARKKNAQMLFASNVLNVKRRNLNRNPSRNAVGWELEYSQLKVHRKSENGSMANLMTLQSGGKFFMQFSRERHTAIQQFLPMQQQINAGILFVTWVDVVFCNNSLQKLYSQRNKSTFDVAQHSMQSF